MKPEFDLTQRGFGVYEFEDLYDTKCSLQKSSLAGFDAIWFGAGSERMHLSRQMVRELLPILQHFADTGEIIPEYERQPIEREWLSLMDEISEPVLEAVIKLLRTQQEWS